MSRNLGIIIGIIIFILIFGCIYTEQSYAKKVDDVLDSIENNEEEQGEIKYMGKFLMPVENFIQVTSKFGYRESHGVVHSNHTGIDLCGSLGSRVMSVQDGEITFAGKQGGYGNCVEIKHVDEQGNAFFTFYAHMRDNSLQVTTGQKVTLGQIIGTQGSTGNSTGDHLHFEMRTNTGSNKYAVDPAPYLFTEKER